MVKPIRKKENEQPNCASVNYYKAPVNQPVATIQNYNLSQGLTHWDKARIESVDNQAISYFNDDMFGDSGASKVIPVTGGKHIFVVHSSYARSLFSDAYETYSEIPANLGSRSSLPFRGIG